MRNSEIRADLALFWPDWGFYFISFATFNAAAAFIIVSSFCSLLFFTIFAPILRKQLWVTLFLSSGLGAIVAGSIMRKVLFTGVVATRTTVRYTRLFIWMDFWYSFTLVSCRDIAGIRVAFFHECQRNRCVTGAGGPALRPVRNSD